MATTLLDLFVLVVISLPLFFRIFLEVFKDDGYLVPVVYGEFDESLLQYVEVPESWRRPTPTVHADVPPVKSNTNWLTPNLSATLIGSASEAVVVFLTVFLRNDVKVDPYVLGDLPVLSLAKKTVKDAGTLVLAPFMGIETTLRAFLKDVIIFILFIDMRQKLLGVEDVVVEEDVVEAEVIFVVAEIEYPYLTSAQYNRIEKNGIRTSYTKFKKRGDSRSRKDDKRRQKCYGAKRRLIGN